MRATFSLGNNMPNSYGFYANSTVTNSRVSVYLCPSDGNAGSLQVLRPADGRMDTLDVNYVASAGTYDQLPEQYRAPPMPGPTAKHRGFLGGIDATASRT